MQCYSCKQTRSHRSRGKNNTHGEDDDGDDNDDEFIIINSKKSQQIKEEMLYEYLVNEYKDLSEKELTQQILENYGDEWFEYVKENN